MDLPRPVDATVREYLRAVDAAAPGLVEGLYLTGSVAMGDFRVGRGLARWAPSGASRSDIDFVAVTGEPVDEPTAGALAGVHRHLAADRSRPSLDGIYLTRSDLARDPIEVTDRVQCNAGRSSRDGSGHPVLWQEMAQHGAAVRGPHRRELTIRTDPDRLREWVRGNLDGYWRRWHRGCARALSPAGALGLTHWIPTWGVLGVARLRYTVDTGRICSKTAGGGYALEVFEPRWHRIVEECLRIRTGRPGRSRYPNPVARRRDALDFVEMVIGPE